MRYHTVAQNLVHACYRSSAAGVLSAEQILEMYGSEEDVEHILVDHPSKQASRLAQLDRAMSEVVVAYETRRLRCPVRPGSVSGTYTPGFGSASSDSEELDRFSTVPLIERRLLEMTPGEFEDLCGQVMQLVGCKGITVTRNTRDEGVDALGELRLEGLTSTHSALHRFGGGISFLVYVQAKAYAEGHAIQQDEVNEVAGSWKTLQAQWAERTLPAETMAALRKADYRQADPVLLALFTTSRFTRGAIAKASAIGMILLDREQIAQLLAEHRVGISRNGAQTWELS